MLRTPEWIADYGAHVGGTVWLNMPEMGVEGEAEVLDIGPAQVYDVRPGLVTGTFRHTSGEVYDLKLESESKPIGVTGTHPFWSVSRDAWVSVLDLEIGETLKTLEGTTVVESLERRSSPEAVYNIEVEGDHCYRVGESGVLVHNTSPGTGEDPSPDPGTLQEDHLFAIGFRSALTRWAKFFSCDWPGLAAAMRGARDRSKSKPFKYTITRQVPRPDPHAKAFGDAVAQMDTEIASFTESVERDGPEKARKSHSARILAAWELVVKNVEDTDVATLVPERDQALVEKGREKLTESKLAVAAEIKKG